ncbi:SAM-dependent methyltransferase [Actinomycetospora chiangmaiensis]|uniref:SAM-dependent methyltransferase n=1 Tax=Actinomycetospora chiangmaiensis TaxID=402650 RepID=UPI00037A9CBC|nr:SAM-dependent methyltransferase [Actinomycetospora chiangmaiensis]
MTDPAVPPGVDVERANVARMYDYWLGGAHNVAVDREHANRIEASNRTARHAARSSRAYLCHVVQWCVERGIDQFLDLGSGVPTVGNVHEIAPAARVAYVDHEAVAVAHSRIRAAAEVFRGSANPVTLRSRAELLNAFDGLTIAAPGMVDVVDWPAARPGVEKVGMYAVCASRP